jgi:hypothetical protein
MNNDPPLTLRVCRIGIEKLPAIPSFTVIVDDERAEDVAYGECVDIYWPAGIHSVCVRTDSMKSNRLTLELRAGVVTELTVELLDDQSPSFLRWVLPIVLHYFLRFDIRRTKLRLVESSARGEG